jgi:hypothetical protein
VNRPGWTSRARVALPAFVGVWCLGAAPVRAEDERALSVSAGWATFSAPGKKRGSATPPEVAPDIGGSLSMIYEQMIGTDLGLRGEAAGTVFSGGNTSKESAASYAAVGDVGVVFRFDILRYVPYAFGGVGGMLTGGGPLGTSGELAIVVGGGLDVLVSRSQSWGIEGRLAAFGGTITVFTLGLRGTMRWGYL